MPRVPTSLNMLEQILAGPHNNINYPQVGWRLSYLPFAIDTQSPETAIILGNNDCFLILYGDHRDGLQGKTRDEAVAYWQARPRLHGATSDSISED